MTLINKNMIIVKIKECHYYDDFFTCYSFYIWNALAEIVILENSILEKKMFKEIKIALTFY